jgi:hypothetical protein
LLYESWKFYGRLLPSFGGGFVGTPAPSGKPSHLEEVRSEFSPAVSEAVLILRVAQRMVLPLRTSSDVQLTPEVAVRTRAIRTQALAVPFRVSRTVISPATKIKVNVSVAIESGIISETVRLVVECDPVPEDRTWKVSLRDAEKDEELMRIPILQRSETIVSKLPFGFYVIELSSDEQSLCRFPFTIEPFSLPEALDAAREYLVQSQYGRAVAILEDASARYPDNAEVWDLLSVVEELAVLDPEAVRCEEQEFSVFRGPADWFKGAGAVLQKMRSKFGESVASLLVARKREQASVPDAMLGSVAGSSVSLPVLQALAHLEQRLKEVGDESHHRDDRLVEILAGVTGRLSQFETHTRYLGEHINAARVISGDADEKFRLVGERLAQFLDDVRNIGVSLPDFAPFFYEKLGEDCWQWIGPDAQKMFLSAEDVYRYFSGSTTAETPDFTPALLEFCRGLELLLNFRLAKLCEMVRNLFSGNRDLQDLFGQEIRWAKLKETIEFKKSYTIPQVAISLRLARVVEQRYPALLGNDGSQLVAISGLSDHESICVLTHIGQIFRNGKVHPYPGSTRMFTTPAEVLVLRKLLFGLDEERVDGDTFFPEFYKVQGFTKGEIHMAANALFPTWSQFPGLVPKIWRAADRIGVLKAAS